MKIEIEINTEKPITNETLEYIADCWVTFVTCDLGLKPNELLMILPDMISVEKVS